MHLIHLEAAVILGILIPQIYSNIISTPSSDCLAAVDTCMSNLCKWSDEALYGNICEDEGCQIKGSQVCNLTVQTVLNQFPSLHGCVCAWEEELCDSIQALATQCHQKPAQQRRSPVMDWQSSKLIGYGNHLPAECHHGKCGAGNTSCSGNCCRGGFYISACLGTEVPTVLEHDVSSSCLARIDLCLRDPVCNKYMRPITTECLTPPCDRDRCQLVTQQFYSSMPHNVAEMLIMCECEAFDQNCLDMKTAVHSGTCGGQTWICQETVNHCVEDSNCRSLLKTLRVTCWSPEAAQCSAADLRHDECISRMDPALLRGADAGCKVAFMATLGSALHYPCVCDGLRNDDLLACNVIHDVLHNRSRFMTSLKSAPPDPNEEAAQSQTWPYEYLLYGFGTVLLLGVVVLVPLAIICKAWTLQRRDRTQFHHPHKSTCVVIL